MYNPELKPLIRTCLFYDECGRQEIHDGKKWKEKWCKFYDDYICGKHYNRLAFSKEERREINKKISQKWAPIKSKRKIIYKKRQIYLDDIPRIGKCSWCNKKVGDEYTNCFGKKSIIKQTHIHHFDKYHDDNVLKDTIELCASCHIKESWRLYRLKKQKP